MLGVKTYITRSRAARENMGPKPLGWMVVDPLDTLLIMECQEEFNRAKRWVSEDLLYDFDYNVNVFETTIRMLGGLPQHTIFQMMTFSWDKAAKLANLLIGGFQQPYRHSVLFCQFEDR